MKQNHWLLMATLIIAGCQGQVNRQYLSSISWLPIDSVFTYHVEKDGDHINSEGYIRADFGRFFPDQRLVITAYLKENLAKGDLDTLEKYIQNMPEISEQFFISKEEAKRKFIAAGNGDFSSVLDKNPLPASIELTVREDYCTIEALTRLKEKLEGQAPYIISEVTLPSWIHPELRKVKTQDCIFRFKT